MQTRSKTGMARQDIFKQIRGNESEHRKCAKKFNQTNQAIQQIKHTNKNAKGSIHLALTLALALVKASSVQTNKRQTKASTENGTINSNNKSSNRTEQANKQIRRRKHLPCSWSCSCTCQGVKTSSVQTNKRQTKARIESGPTNSNKQIKQSNRSNKQNRQAAAFLALSHDDLFSVVFLLKRNASSVASKNS